MSRAVFGKAISTLRRHLLAVENLTRENHAALDLQFKRIASIQAELDQLLAQLRRMP